MSTNFYYYDAPPCEKCGRNDEPRHIGKSSAGWRFALRVYPDEGIKDLRDWRKLWAKPGSRIEDEYGDPWTVERMQALIANKRHGEARLHSPKKIKNGPDCDYLNEEFC